MASMPLVVVRDGCWSSSLVLLLVSMVAFVLALVVWLLVVWVFAIGALVGVDVGGRLAGGSVWYFARDDVEKKVMLRPVF